MRDKEDNGIAQNKVQFLFDTRAELFTIVSKKSSLYIISLKLLVPKISSEFSFNVFNASGVSF
jgi:hypothetical protein